MTSTFARSLSLGAVILSAAPDARSQVPDGWYVTAHSTLPGVPGLGGLWLHHPRTPGLSTRVQGLPNDLTGLGSTGIQGATSVLAVDGGDLLLVGEGGPAGSQIELHAIWLSGNTVVRHGRAVLGIAGNPVGQVTQIAPHPDGGFLVAVDRIATGPLGGQAVGLITLGTAPSIRPLFARPAGNIVVHGVAADSYGEVYVNARDRLTAWSDIWIIPRIGTPWLFSRVVPAVGNLHARNWCVVPGGSLCFGWLAAGYGNRILFLDTVQSLGRVLNTCTMGTSLNAFAPEETTGGWAIAGGLGGINPNSVSHAGQCGPATMLNPPPPGGWGVINGIDVIADPRPYGSPSPGNCMDWSMPFPGGLPTVGNAAFALSATCLPPGSSMAVVLSPLPGYAPLPAIGIVLLLDPRALIPLPPGPATGISLAIPNLSALRNTTLYAQAFGVTASPTGYVLNATSGLRITIL